MAKKLLRTMAMIVMGRSLSRHGSVALSLQSRSHVSRQRVLSSTIALRLDVSGKATDIILPSHVQKWLDLELPEGRCVGVSMTEAVERDARLGDDKLERIWMQRAYHPDEIVYGNTLSGTTAESFWLGRLAMRLALDFPEYPILKDSYGRPVLHGRWLGSISHKGFCGVALVAQSTSEIAGIGIDLEFASRPGKRSIAPRVLTERELQSLGEIPGVSAEEEVLLRFSLKEAIYKAVHPVLCKYVSFQEAEVTPMADGTATCTWLLESGDDAVLRTLRAHWRRLDGGNFFLTSASIEKGS